MTFTSDVAPLNAARTAQRAIPTIVLDLALRRPQPLLHSVIVK